MCRSDNPNLSGRYAQNRACPKRSHASRLADRSSFRSLDNLSATAFPKLQALNAARVNFSGYPLRALSGPLVNLSLAGNSRLTGAHVAIPVQHLQQWCNGRLNNCLNSSMNQ